MKNSIDSAITLADLGFNVIPLKSASALQGAIQQGILNAKEADQKTKEPQSRALGWNRPPFADSEEIAEWGDCNYGVLCSVEFGGVVVVDTDSEAAEEWAAAHLPPTPFTFKAKRGKHRYYQGRGFTKTLKPRLPATDERGEINIDVIVNGYVVGPNSLRIDDAGESFESYVQEGGEGLTIEPGELPEITPRDLESLGGFEIENLNNEWCRIISLEPLVVEALPTRIKADWCFKSEAGQGNADACDVIEFAIFGDELSFDETLERLEHWNSLRDKPHEGVEKLLRWYWRKHSDRVNAPEYGRSGAVPEALTIEPAKPQPIEEDFSTLPGALGLFVDHFMETAPSPHVDLAVFSALAFGSVCASRHYVTETGLYSPLFLAAVAGTGVGKDHAKKLIPKIFKAANAEYLMGPAGYKSAGGLLSSLKRSPNHLAVIDEFGDMVSELADRRFSQTKALWAALRDIYSSPGGEYVPGAYSREGAAGMSVDEHKTIKKPNVTILGLTTKQQLLNSIGEKQLEDGTLNRFIFCINDKPRKRPKRSHLRRGFRLPIPEKLIDWTKRTTDRRRRGEQADGFNPVGFEAQPELEGRAFREPERQETVVCYTGEAHQFIESAPELEPNNPMFARFEENAERIMLILAVSVNPTAPIITEEIARWALGYCSHLYKRFDDSFTKERAASEWEEKLLTVETTVRRAGVGGLTNWELKRKLRRFPPAELQRLVDQLIELEDLHFGVVRTQSKKARYFHNSFIKGSGAIH